MVLVVYDFIATAMHVLTLGFQFAILRIIKLFTVVQYSNSHSYNVNSVCTLLCGGPIGQSLWPPSCDET